MKQQIIKVGGLLIFEKTQTVNNQLLFVQIRWFISVSNNENILIPPATDIILHCGILGDIERKYIMTPATHPILSQEGERVFETLVREFSDLGEVKRGEGCNNCDELNEYLVISTILGRIFICKECNSARQWT